MSTREITTRVVGGQYAAGWRTRKEGAYVQLVAEPNNPHDPHAIKVMQRHRHLGYVPRGDAAQITPNTLAWLGQGGLLNIFVCDTASELNDLIDDLRADKFEENV